MVFKGQVQVGIPKQKYTVRFKEFLPRMSDYLPYSTDTSDLAPPPLRVLRDYEEFPSHTIKKDVLDGSAGTHNKLLR